jgi:hypothetical protein
VTLVRRWIVHRPLTAAPIDDGGWQEFAYYTWTPEAPS